MLFDEEKHTQRQQKIDIWKPVLIISNVLG